MEILDPVSMKTMLGDSGSSLSSQVDAVGIRRGLFPKSLAITAASKAVGSNFCIRPSADTFLASLLPYSCSSCFPASSASWCRPWLSPEPSRPRAHVSFRASSSLRYDTPSGSAAPLTP